MVTQAKLPAMPITERCPLITPKQVLLSCFSNMCSGYEVRHAALINTKLSRRLPGTATLTGGMSLPTVNQT